MSESLSEEQLAELIRSGRINTSKSAAKKRQTKKSKSDQTETHEKSVPKVRDSPRQVEQTTPKEPDPEWLRAEKEKAERNIAAQRQQDKRRRDELLEASRF